MRPQQHVFVSPHPDDAVLSCGGTVARLARAGHRVLLVTVFAAGPAAAEVSAFGQRHFALWQGADADAADPFALRQAEDREAARLLGATPLYALYADAPFRRHPREGRWLYTSDDALFGPPDPSEGDLPHRIAGEITTLLEGPHATVYVPLGLGRHVDHVLLAQAGRHLAQAGYRVRWYEDFPYARQDARGHELEARGWRAWLVPLTWPLVHLKLRAIGCYRSQLPSLFGDEQQARRAVVDYMLTVSGLGYPAERFWIPPTGSR